MWVLLCVSAPITIIDLVPSLDDTGKRISGRQTSVGAMPRFLSVQDIRRNQRGLGV
ncbi:MAG: hypothetical protein JO240_11020 [Solirubrobacterales bacterium]|nr:hypothetical protein [Solirubrobacterales bacterium]